MMQKTIVLGVCGGIAAYKSCELASRLTQNGAQVHVVMTEGATHFVAPQTFAALTLQPVHTSLWPQNLESDGGVAASMAHISLAREADAILIAPATANTMAKLAHGFSDDLLTTICLATRAPILISPAMNPQMWLHAATQKNIQLLEELGYTIVQPESGRMACEDVGSGRLPEASALLEALNRVLDARQNEPQKPQDYAGKTVLVTAGPTREPLDPVRFLTNRSSGKMGYAIAHELESRGAKVHLVSGPTNLEAPENVERMDVTTTQEMFHAATTIARDCDIIVACAAPADYRAKVVAAQKIKKSSTRNHLQLELEATPDIVAAIAHNKKPDQIVVGFAAETENLVRYAQQKLTEKNLDAIVANDVSQLDSGFESDHNRVTWISKEVEESWPLMNKSEVAARLCDVILQLTK
ncbi:MAG TPA: bifunctional phosphopantothenoylcysteine decarboxylase/phosphopantothenate--cysteine ligase CoaBC [Abditibacteriaceae bacterium]|nr:bifunctional phosphopantothenoylcysteine decarboxylase/phosphopantothenate--cysteine ligase CoaBC [Abditibacteriaceae bacterium]